MFTTDYWRPIQEFFGEDASASPAIVLPIVLAVFVICIIMIMRTLLKDKGKSEMTEEELEQDRAIFDTMMHRKAENEGYEYVPERARAVGGAPPMSLLNTMTRSI